MTNHDQQRTIAIFADRLLPILEALATSRNDDTITYSVAAALIRRRGEDMIPPQLIGKVLDEISENYDPNLVAFIVSKGTGQVSHGYDRGVELGAPADPAEARRLAREARGGRA